MTEKIDQEDQEVELQGMLAKRLVVAGVLVGILLAVLAFFDYLATQEETPDPPVFTEPVPVPPKKALSQPVTPVVDDLPVLPVEPEDPALPPVEPVPAEPPPPPEVTAKPEVVMPAPLADPVSRPAGKPASATRADATPPARPPVVQPVASPTPVAEGTSAPTTQLSPAPDAKPTASVLTPPPAAPAQPALQPIPARPLASGYLVQAGVFSSTKAAEELHAKLTLNGIPSTLETRVQIGPFKSRAEADAARQKLKALGIEGMMIPPAGRR